MDAPSRFRDILLIVILLSFSGVSQVHPAYALTATIRPDGDSDWQNGNEWNVQGVTNRWEAVNEVSSDDDASHVYADDKNKVQLFLLQDPIALGSVDSVKVFVRVKQATVTDDFKIVIRIDSTNNYFSDAISTTTSYSPYTHEWTTNPGTGSSWTWAELDSLQTGVRSNKAGIVGETSYGEIRLTQLWVEVTYTLQDSSKAEEEEDPPKPWQIENDKTYHAISVSGNNTAVNVGWWTDAESYERRNFVEGQYLHEIQCGGNSGRCNARYTTSELLGIAFGFEISREDVNSGNFKWSVFQCLASCYE